MIQIVQLVGEVIHKNENGNVTVQVHTHYVTQSDLVIRNAEVICKPTLYIKGPAFDKLEKGNLVFMQGRLRGNEFGSPFLNPEGVAVFALMVEDMQLLAHNADEKRDSDLFQIILIGNLGRDPETRYTDKGDEFVTTSIAVNYKERDEEETTWFKTTIWRTSKLSSMVKGMRAFILGHLRFDEKTGGPLVWYTQEGSPRSNYEVNIKRLIPLVKVEEKTDEPVPF